MRIIYFVRNITISGGVKVLVQHVRLLKQQGFDAALLTLRDECPGFYTERSEVITGRDDGRLRSDVAVATKPSDVMWLFDVQRNRSSVLCHLCQGDDVGDLRARLRRLIDWKTPVSMSVFRLVEALKLYQRLRRYERSYRLPTKKMAVSAHLCQQIAARYRQPCVEIPNGVDLTIFRDAGRQMDQSTAPPWRIVSVGRGDTEIKGIGDVLAAARFLREAGYSIHVTRIAGEPMTSLEGESGVIDRYWRAVSEEQVASLLRESHVLVAGSSEAEGFGLPALEAMACGIPCVLTAVPCYLGYAAPSDFAHFAPQHSPRALADGIVKIMTDSDYRALIVRRGLEVARAYSLASVGSKLASFFSGLARHEQSV